MTGRDVNELARWLDEYVPVAMAVTATPGVTVAVRTADGLTFEGAWGEADLAERTPMTPKATVQAGSLSKPLLGIACMQLAERGALDLHEPVDGLIGFPVRNPFGRGPVTAYHLLTHTSGLHTDTFGLSRRPSRLSLAEELAGIMERGRGREYGGHVALWSAPVGSYRYSSYGMALLALIVQEASGQEFGAYVQEHVLSRAGMVESALQAPGSVPGDLTERLATGYQRLGRLVVPMPRLCSQWWPSTGLITTPRDYVRLLMALMEPGRLLSAAGARELLTPQVAHSFPGEPVAMGVGLGFQLHDGGGERASYGHGGAWPGGFWSDARAYPRQGYAVAVTQTRWDLTGYTDPHGRNCTGLITEQVRRWAAGERMPTRRQDREAAHAYAAGLLVRDRIRGVQDVDEFDADEVAAMASGARVIPAPDPAGFDQAAFVAAMHAPGDESPASSRQRAERGPVPPADLGLIALAAGARSPRLAATVAHWAERAEEDQALDHLDALRTGGDALR